MLNKTCREHRDSRAWRDRRDNDFPQQARVRAVVQKQTDHVCRGRAGCDDTKIVNTRAA
ncbi:MAG: hypothetical protein ACK55I_02055 [bacterium]